MQILRQKRLRPPHRTDIEAALQLVEWPLQSSERHDVLWVQTNADGQQEETRLTPTALPRDAAERVFDEAYAQRRAAGDVALDGDEAEAFPAESLPPPLPPPPPLGHTPTARPRGELLPDPPPLDLRPMLLLAAFFAVILGVLYSLV